MARTFDHDGFGRLIEDALKSGPAGAPRRLSQQDFAVLVGVDPATVYRWSTGKTVPSRKTVENIARILGWPPNRVDELFLGSTMSRPMAGNDLKTWIKITGLRSDFPLLCRPAWFDVNPWLDEDRWPLREAPTTPPLSSDRLRSLCEDLTVSGVVELPAGQGITMAVRAAYRSAVESSLLARQIPVLLSIEDLVDMSYESMLAESIALLDEWHAGAGLPVFDESPDAVDELRDRADEVARRVLGGVTATQARQVFEQKIRWSLIWGLLSRPWDRIHRNLEPYVRLLGMDDTGDEQLARSGATTLDERRALLCRVLPADHRGDWGPIESLAPALVRDEIDEIVGQLDMRLQLLLQVDLSPTPVGRVYLGPVHGEYLTTHYTRAATAVMQALKALLQTHGASRAEGSVAEPFLEVAIAAPRDSVAREFDVLVGNGIRTAPGLEPEELFDILAADAFRPEVRVPSRGLDDVLDDRYIELASNRGLTTTSWLLRQTLALTRDRRVHDRGDEETARRLGAVYLRLQHADDLEQIARMLELMGFERRKKTTSSGAT